MIIVDEAHLQRTLDNDLARLLASEPHAMADPFPLWNRLRVEAPFHKHDIFYLASRGRTVRQIFTDQRMQMNPFGRGAAADAIRARLKDEARHAFDVVTAFEAMYMSRTDGEIHDRLRRIAQRTFTPRRIGLIRYKVETHRATRWSPRCPRARTVDLMPFAYRLPLIIIGDMLGVPDEDLDMVHGWSSRLGAQPRRHRSRGADGRLCRRWVSSAAMWRGGSRCCDRRRANA